MYHLSMTHWNLQFVGGQLPNHVLNCSLVVQNFPNIVELEQHFSLLWDLLNIKLGISLPTKCYIEKKNLLYVNNL